jgi:hypothetical protein
VQFGAGGGGIDLQYCAVTDDGVRCALEYNLVRWGRYDVPPQAGLGVYERGPDGLLVAARIYDDIESPGPADPDPADPGPADPDPTDTDSSAGLASVW